MGATSATSACAFCSCMCPHVAAAARLPAAVAASRSRRESPTYATCVAANLTFAAATSSQVTEPMISVAVQNRRAQRLTVGPEHFTQARRDAVELTRNAAGGFWCCHTNPAAADHAITGVVPRSDLAGVVAASDGATRGFQLLGVHTVAEVAHRAIDGEGMAVIEEIRAAEHASQALTDRGMKKYDDATLVAQRIDGE